MDILKKLEIDGVCRKYAAAITLCAALLGMCGAARDAALFGVPAEVFGDIAACAALTLYASMLVCAFGKALLETAESYSELIRLGGRISAAVCVTAQAVKLFFLLLPSPEGAAIPHTVLIADTLTWWILPMKHLEESRAAWSRVLP